MNTKFCLFLVGIIFLISCNKDENISVEELKPSIELLVFSEESGRKQPLMNATVYVYDGIAPIDLVPYNYDGKGNYIKGSCIISPDQILFTDRDRKVVIYPPDSESSISVFVENKIMNILSHSYWPSCYTNFKEEIVFENN